MTICPEDYYLLIKEKEQCIEDCSKDDEYKYQYNGECFKECPNNSSDNNDHICLDNNISKCSLSRRKIEIKNEIITEDEKENLAKSYAKEFSYTDNHISFFNYGNNEIVFYKNYECIIELGLEVPSVELGDCYKKIQESYELELNNSLILGVVAQRSEDINYPIITSFSVYHPIIGNRLDIISICDNNEINVQEDIEMKIPDKQKYTYVKELTKQEVDVFNLSSELYTDLCYHFDSPVKKDVAMKDRVKLFYPNITLCENGCNIKGINITTMKAECECKLDNLMNNNILSNNVWYQAQVKEIEEILSEINFSIIKCGSKIFKEDFAAYTGSVIISVLILVQIVLTIYHFVDGITPLKKYLFIIVNAYSNFIKKEGNAENAGNEGNIENAQNAENNQNIQNAENAQNAPPKRGSTLHCLEIKSGKNVRNYGDKNQKKRSSRTINNSTKSKNFLSRHKSSVGNLNMINMNSGEVMLINKTKLKQRKHRSLANGKVNFKITEDSNDLENDLYRKKKI